MGEDSLILENLPEHLPEEFLQASGNYKSNIKINLPRRLKFSAYGKHLQTSGAEISSHFGESSLLPFQQGVPAIDKFPFETWGKIAQKWQKNPPVTEIGCEQPKTESHRLPSRFNQ